MVCCDCGVRINRIIALVGLSCFVSSGQDTVSAQDTRTTTIASFYGAECSENLMANGKPFKPEALTCASWFYPLGTRLKVSSGNKYVVVEVTDRGPAKRLADQGRTLDLSEGAFKKLSQTNVGLIAVTIKKLK